jgi:putative SOS response-associated peptidase YedK
MYDRLTIGASAEELEKKYEAKIETGFVPTYNAAPTQKHPIITNKKPGQIQLFHWGLISKLSNNKSISPRLFNLSTEMALNRPMFQKPLAQNRCAVIVDGFYVWKKLSKKQLIPYFFCFNDRALFTIAGIWEEFEDFDGSVSRSFNMLTTTASKPLSAFQEDQPVILTTETAKTWLSDYSKPEQIRAILENIQQLDLNYHPVSPLINNLKIYDQRLIEPTQPSDQHGNYTLF